VTAEASSDSVSIIIHSLTERQRVDVPDDGSQRVVHWCV